MRYPPHILDEIRARLPVSSVVGRKVRLKKAGREWRGLSPFNAERTPSFYANDQKGFYHCFSSGKHGDVFTFLMETEGLSFPEAVERLAAESGVDLPRPSPQAAAQEGRRRTLHEVMELACSFYQAGLDRAAGRAARDYLDGRGIGEDERRAFRIGFASPDRHGLRDHLAGKGVTPELMIEAGLLIAGDEVAVPYDRFRDRIMFPIEDGRGRVVAFGGRAMRADVPAKYLNSPDTPLFSKGRLLYNLHRARGPAHEAGSVIAVEGYVDVIGLTQVGFANTVAPLGTALTEEQLELLWRIADEPVLCFDGDRAGRRAAGRVLDLALPLLTAGKSLRFAHLPEGQDPDDLARSGGRGGVAAIVAAARPLVEELLARESETAASDTPERRAASAGRLREAVSTIGDPTVRQFYRDAVEARIRESRKPAADGRGRWPARGEGGQLGRQAGTGFLGRPLASVSSNLLARTAGEPNRAGVKREALIALTLLAHPAILHREADALASLELADRDSREVSAFLLDVALEGEAIDPAVIAARAERAGLGPALERARGRVPPGDRWMLEPTADPLLLADALRQAFALQRRARTLDKERRAAELAFGEDGSEASWRWLQEVNAELQSLDGTEAERGHA